MKYFLGLLFLIGNMFSFSQDSTGTQKLEVQFREAYYYQFNENENFFNRLYRASMYVFNLENNVFYGEVSLRKKQNKTHNIDSIAGNIFDSVVSWFTNNHLWDHAPYAPAKFRTYFTIYNDMLCPCVSDKLAIPGYKLNETDVANCINSLNTDTAYTNRVRREMHSPPMSELKFMSQLAGAYIFQHCPALYKFFVDIPRNEIIASTYIRNNLYLREVDKKVSDLYISKSFARLEDIFPGYKNYTSDINSLKGILDKKEFYTLYDQKSISAGKTQVTKTYYSYINKKTEVYGQSIYIIDEESIDPTLLSLQFIATGKIKNLKLILKKIEEQESLAPPEVKELEDTKIDVITVDSLQKKKKN